MRGIFKINFFVQVRYQRTQEVIEIDAIGSFYLKFRVTYRKLDYYNLHSNQENPVIHPRLI